MAAFDAGQRFFTLNVHCSGKSKFFPWEVCNAEVFSGKCYSHGSYGVHLTGECFSSRQRAKGDYQQTHSGARDHHRHRTPKPDYRTGGETMYAALSQGLRTGLPVEMPAADVQSMPAQQTTERLPEESLPTCRGRRTVPKCSSRDGLRYVRTTRQARSRAPAVIHISGGDQSDKLGRIASSQRSTAGS